MVRSLFVAVAAAAALVAPSHAALFQYEANLSGPAESPPNASPGIGYATADYDDVAHTLHLQVTFSDLLGNVTNAHIHAPTAVAGMGTAGVATTTPTFAGFPSGVTAGNYNNTLDLTLASSWNPAFITANGGTTAGAEAALAASLANGTAYLNIHSTLFPPGEIRGFFQPIPEPATLALVAAAGLTMLRRQPSTR